MILKSVLMRRLGGGRVLRAVVLDSDASGVWIDNRRFGDEKIDVLLVKWDYVEALGFEASLSEPQVRRPIGFQYEQSLQSRTRS